MLLTRLREVPCTGFDGLLTVSDALHSWVSHSRSKPVHLLFLVYAADGGAVNLGTAAASTGQESDHDSYFEHSGSDR